jgi:hypothetical protein
MKTFANMCVVAVILGVAMSGEVAKADFNNAQVKDAAGDLALTAELGARQVQNLDIPRGQKIVFRNVLNQIAQNALRIEELADRPDNQVEDQIEDLARDSRNRAKDLLERAEDLNNEDLIEGMELLLELIDRLENLVD